jgi:hypothetical protein
VPVEFPEDSYTLPPGPCAATAEEIKVALVDAFQGSSTREGIFDDWKGLLSALTDAVPIRKQWIHGSYVTQKLDPGDVDVVSHFDGPTLDAIEASARDEFNRLISGKGPGAPLCDSLALGYYPEGHELRDQYLSLEKLFAEMCSCDRRGNPRGYIDLKDQCLASTLSPATV